MRSENAEVQAPLSHHPADCVQAWAQEQNTTDMVSSSSECDLGLAEDFMSMQSQCWLHDGTDQTLIDECVIVASQQW